MNPLVAPVLSLLLLPLQGRQRLFQPTDYASPSGSHVLAVAPSHPAGIGPMKLRLLRDNEELWATEFPWTFDEAGVADDGSVVGYSNGARLRIVVLDPKGAVRKEHAFEHAKPSLHRSALPRASGKVLIHGEAGLALVRVDLTYEGDFPSLWGFRLSTGDRAEDVLPSSPISLVKDQSLYLQDARAIGNTGLTLSHWGFWDSRRIRLAWSEPGAVFSLVDLKGRTVWNLPLLDDYTDPSSEKSTQTLLDDVRGRVILSTGPDDRFALWHVRTKQRVEYSVERVPSSEPGWVVTEVSREPFVPVWRPKIESERIELPLESTVSLRTEAATTSGLARDVLRTGFGDVRIDSLGRILVRDSTTEAIHVFGSDGLLRFTCQIDPGETGYGTFDVSTDRTIAVNLKEGRALFDLQGKRMRDAESNDRAGEPSLKAREADDPAAHVSIRRRPDGRWLVSRNQERGTLPDGTIIVLEHPDGDEPSALHLYDPEGAPLRSIELAGEEPWHDLSISKRWIIVSTYTSSSLLVRVEDWRVFRFDPGLGDGFWLTGQTDDGRSFLLLRQDRLELHRYALP